MDLLKRNFSVYLLRSIHYFEIHFDLREVLSENPLKVTDSKGCSHSGRVVLTGYNSNFDLIRFENFLVVKCKICIAKPFSEMQFGWLDSMKTSQLFFQVLTTSFGLTHWTVANRICRFTTGCNSNNAHPNCCHQCRPLIFSRFPYNFPANSPSLELLT